jgi:alkanesulfonate monooxygenase SsuD/methylene tetrahydromethanopterin reductase-like flavin-dependent oxidoreductase (luciferase family)
MKCGVLQFFSWPQRRVPLPTVYERALQRIAIMDKTGYDAVWLAEHHFTHYSVCPSVHLMGMHVAGQTQQLRIGMGISLAAFYHPLRLAEEVALLDVLSGGRVNWGAGRGFDPTEFKAFGVPPQESHRRFREAVEIVLAAWQNERLTWDGDYWHFEDIEVLPKPLQQPHPHTWIAASSLDSVCWAASQGYSIMLGPHTHYTDLGQKREIYRKALEAHGHTITGRDIPMARLLAVAETEQAAEAIARQGAQWLVESYVNPAKAAKAVAMVTSRHDQSNGTLDPIELYLDGIIIYGTPERVLDQLQQLHEEIWLDYLLCAPLSHSSFLMFTEKVLPRLL